MGAILGVICGFIFILAWAACDTEGDSNDWSEYDDPFENEAFAKGYLLGLDEGRRGMCVFSLTEKEAAELILTEAELLESDAEGDDEGEFEQKTLRLAAAMRMGAEALERSLEC